MTELIIVKGFKMFTTTIAISEGTNNEHESVMLLLKKHSNIEALNRFEIGLLKTKRRPITFAYLSELQATLLIVLMKNSPEVIDFKVKLTEAFFKQRKLLQKLLSQKDNAEWLAKRQETKTVRLEETDVIKKFVNYATDQGSKSAHMYYVTISKMENKALFLIEQKYKNLRDIMNFRQLNLIEVADDAVRNTLEYGMSKNLPYKEIYQLAKIKIEALAKVVGISPLPALLEKNLTEQTKSIE